MFVGLVHEPGRGPGDEEPEPARRVPHVPWQPFAWFAAFCWLMVAAGAAGGLAGYLLVLAAIALGCWRLDRWCSRQYWSGLREYQR